MHDMHVETRRIVRYWCRSWHADGLYYLCRVDQLWKLDGWTRRLQQNFRQRRMQRLLPLIQRMQQAFRARHYAPDARGGRQAISRLEASRISGG